MANPTRPFRVIELITLLVIASIIVAITLPRCAPSETTNHNQPTPTSKP